MIENNTEITAISISLKKFFYELTKCCKNYKNLRPNTIKTTKDLIKSINFKF